MSEKLKLGLVNIDTVASELQLSKERIYQLVALRRKGLSDFPLPIGNFKSHHRWVASEISDWVYRRNDVANGRSAPPSHSASLPPETLMAAAKLGLLDDDNTNVRRGKKGGVK